MVTMSNMFPNMLEPEMRLSRFHLMLTACLLAVAELLAKLADIQIDCLKGLDLLCSILQKSHHLCFRFRLARLQFLNPGAQSGVFVRKLFDASVVVGDIAP